ncbi:unnamed protein product [Rhizophagus irregularis]|uniref:Phosphatidylglycerol/phosphatidylinositol transfer protein n=1 Tax=Rhizophagus irregularis TaxID=588596 RepID=A0A2I1G3U6_9GLOM|nr:hypothetical protein RhiirA4_454866 [Rhizophagus irregularis]CAB4439524.1 unnamed protein product [Rhizophagus irregularis]
MKKDIVAGDWVSITFFDVAKQPIEDTHWLDICTIPGVTCPIKAGTAFSTTQKYTAPKELPQSYVIVIATGHGQGFEAKPIACSVAFIGGSESSAVSADLNVWGFL